MRLSGLFLLLLGIFFAFPTVANAGTRTGTFASGGITRTYRLYRPNALVRESQAPLVVMLHGGFGTAQQAENAYHWDSQADKAGFVVLYPDGVGRAWNAGACCGRPVRDNLDDVGFITQLVRAVAQDENVDLKRVYVTGMSNGAMMAYRMACESSLAIAAIGPVAGTFSKPCDRPHRTSVLAIHGTADPLVPYHGGSGAGFDRSPRPSVPDVISAWRKTDDCERPTLQVAGVVTYDFSRCAEGRNVELITIANVAHAWPGGRSTPSTPLDATATLWNFFASQYPH